jgi:hypothetical protein
MAALLFFGGAFSLQNRREGKSPACEMSVGRSGGGRAPQQRKNGHKKQGRRRNIPSTTLPAPDIEIGSRHPVNYRMTGILTGICEPVHKCGKKLRHGVPHSAAKYAVGRLHGAVNRSGHPPNIAARIPAMTVLVRRLERQGTDRCAISAAAPQPG